MFVINSDWIPLACAVFFDDPEVSCVLGLDFIEIVCLTDKPEIRGSEKPVFLSAEHYGIPLSAGRKLSADIYNIKPSVSLSCSLPLLRIMESAMHPLAVIFFIFCVIYAAFSRVFKYLKQNSAIKIPFLLLY